MSQVWNQKEEPLDAQEVLDNHGIDLQLIQTIQSKRNLFEIIVASLCPQVMAQKPVKRGLVLALFGGVAKHDRSTKLLATPQQIQVLIFGNHGSQKDVLLKSVHSVSPKANYVCGNTATVGSLINRRRGSLVSKRYTICCIDEFDRMPLPALSSVHEAMDHQSVTFTRNSELSLKWTATAVAAAVNPCNGDYDPALNVWQNTRLSKSLLSKFDLIFVLTDCPDEEMDTRLANRILKSRNGVTVNESDLFSAEDLRQYIRYTQKFVNPVLTTEAEEEIWKFCQEFSVNSISRSQTRNFEVLYRLTEARARVESRSEATKDDVEEVIELIKESEGKFYYACEYLTSTLSGKRSSKKKRMEAVHQILQHLSSTKGQNEFNVKEIVEICETNRLGFGSKDEVLDCIDVLNEGGVLLKKGSGVYGLV